jgi:hypothetical protein
LERRIYRVDRLRLNPNGLPVRGLVYFLAILAIVLIAASLPLIGLCSRVLPWYLRDLALPAGSAALLTMIRLEGRPFHLAVRALLRYGIAPRYLAGTRRCRAPGWRWCPAEILMLPDGSDGRLRGMSYTGPGTVLVRAAHERTESSTGAVGRLGRRPRLTLRGLPERRTPARGQVIALAAGVRLRVRSTVLTPARERAGRGKQ